MIKLKKILITGGSSGLGHSLAIKLAKKNKIYCLGRSDVKQKNIKSVKCDFKNIKSIKGKLKKLLNTKKLDYVFLNAGMLGEIKNINKIKYDEINEILKVNVFANKEILDFFIEKKIKTKLIIAISSGAALAPKFGWFLYCSSKAAFKFLIESYALEDSKRSFINISPGLIKTKMQNQICKIDEKKISSVKKFKILNKQNKIPSSDEVADNIINIIQKLKKSSGSYIDIRK
jgi:NAD(P)-dependent dehydrogenase (short-subunit alcohol dehydrogenase family)|tara:strand:- start:7793 stop:8485 length:693 start_codon:yes stop_codon:yes gene_type:complete